MDADAEVDGVKGDLEGLGNKLTFWLTKDFSCQFSVYLSTWVVDRVQGLDLEVLEDASAYFTQATETEVLHGHIETGIAHGQQALDCRSGGS